MDIILTKEQSEPGLCWPFTDQATPDVTDSMVAILARSSPIA